VLELGCGDGSNLVPMAWALPQSEFLGIDLASRPILKGQQMISELGLPNIRLVQGSITEITPDHGKFDYIIAHGLYSWVPAEVQTQLLAICRNCLQPNGMAFVSYNALPGGHMRNMLREMMLFHVRGFDSPAEKVEQAVEFVKLLAYARDPDDEYRVWLRAELESILAHNEGHLFHDELAELNEPVYFTQFMERATAHGLQYLAEANYFDMFAHNFKPLAQHALARLAGNRIAREQYLDFIKCRRFRQTLLCHREANLLTEPPADKVAGFLISSLAQCKTTPVNLAPGISMSYQTPGGARCETDFAAGKAALALMVAAWPMPFSFDDLLDRAMMQLRQEGFPDDSNARLRENFLEFLLNLYSAGIVEFRTGLSPATRTASERPLASPIARWQAQRGSLVTTVFHIPVKLEDEIGRSLLLWLDGTLDRNALLVKLWDMLKSKDALILPGGNETVARQELATKLDQNLQKLADLGLLVG
jgi:methyltransferase-like protein